jgi:hypothetical protein
MYPYLYMRPQVKPNIPTASNTHTSAADTLFDSQLIAYPGGAYILAMYYQVVTTIANDLVAGIIALAQVDRDLAVVEHIPETEITMVDAVAAADTITMVRLTSPYLIPQGHGIASLLHTAGTDGAAVAGDVKVWWLMQPVGA